MDSDNGDREQLIQEIIVLSDEVAKIVEQVTGRPKNHTQMGKAKLRELEVEQLKQIKTRISSYYKIIKNYRKQPSRLAEI